MIQPETLAFLRKLRRNNNKPWFEKNKGSYLEAKADVEQFIRDVNERLNQTDVIEFNKLFRIYRDVRFSRDKTPYKTYFSGYFRRAGKERRGGYWFSIEPGESQIGGGFYGPNKEDLYRIRKEFQMDSKTINRIIGSTQFKNLFGPLQGEAVKTAPKGFSKDDPSIELIRKTQFYVFREFSDKEVLRDDFVGQAAKTYRTLRHFFDYMSEVLTTDLNGESL